LCPDYIIMEKTAMRPVVLNCQLCYGSVTSNMQASDMSLTHCRVSVIIWQL